MINTLIIDKIQVDELSSQDMSYGITNNASAILSINGYNYNVPKEGCTINLNSPLKENDIITAKLYMYDRQPHNGHFFTVDSEPVQTFGSNVAKMRFQQWGPSICFALLNYSDDQ